MKKSNVLKKNKSAIQEVNLLDLVPIRNIKWKKNPDERVVLLKPKIQISFLAKYLLPLMKKPYYHINLDEVGSFFWEKCDGNRSIKEIAKLQKGKFGDSVEPLLDRIGAFLKSLEKSNLITIKTSSSGDSKK